MDYYVADVDAGSGRWKGEARIPVSYFPPNITRFNAYAIHGPPEDRRSVQEKEIN